MTGLRAFRDLWAEFLLAFHDGPRSTLTLAKARKLAGSALSAISETGGFLGPGTTRYQCEVTNLTNGTLIGVLSRTDDFWNLIPNTNPPDAEDGPIPKLPSIHPPVDLSSINIGDVLQQLSTLVQLEEGKAIDRYAKVKFSDILVRRAERKLQDFVEKIGLIASSTPYRRLLSPMTYKDLLEMLNDIIIWDHSMLAKGGQ